VSPKNKTKALEMPITEEQADGAIHALYN